VNLDMPAGEQEIDADTALAYVRTRVDQDYGRMARQQEVLEEIARKALEAEGDIDFRAVLDSFESLETNIPLDKISTLLELARRAQEGQVTNFLLEPPEFITFEGDRGDGRGYILEADFDAVRARIAELIPSE
jgi:anionic cell wall polymer biosynthesis LytR-Cps2A-Psr (LCP) family protein